MHMQQTKFDLDWFKQCCLTPDLVQQLKQIKLVICDVDGTLTSAGVYVDEQGEGGREFSVQDGFIVKPAQQAGITIALMSGKANLSTIQRAEKLGIPAELCMIGLETKPEAVRTLQHKLVLDAQQTLLIGDDFLDAEVKINRLVSLYACPSNTPFYLQQLADIVIPHSGGKNAFRLIMDLVLYVQQKHFAQDFIKKLVG